MFSKDFVWGVASSAYQMEGMDEQDGRGVSIWDTFLADGHVPNGDDAKISCDHMHHYKEDYKLMKWMGIKAYRFSISWSRLMPDGIEVNQKAVSLYRDMIQEMKKNGIEPYLTMYHWDLPQALQDQGGWLNDKIVDWFGGYAKVIAENFGDLCDYYITLNEPQCFVGIGHLSGIHAPGLKLSYKETFQIAHNALKAHGMAVKQLRKYAGKPIKVGYAPTCGMAYPATETPEDIEAARKVLFSQWQPMDNWTWNVAWFLDPVVFGKYPEDGLERYKEYLPEITQEDMELISQPLDFLGQNIYNGYAIKAGEDGNPVFLRRDPGYTKTAANWPVTPKCFYWGLKFLYERYQLPMYATENGMSCHDEVSPDGRVHDQNRIDFLDAYISEMERCIEDGVDLRGYFVWTILDNFEWDRGYNERFGLVYVDFVTQQRIVKDSGYWYKKVMETNGANLSIHTKPRQLLFLHPAFQDKIWGGNRLKTEWNYSEATDKTGECWAISAHPAGESVIESGYYRGKKLSELWEEDRELFGNVQGEKFPLLTKIIDAADDLSIQVHPDDTYANTHENGSYGKTECWYVLDCPEDAELVIGHNASSREELRKMIEDKEWDNLIRKVPVRKGDFIQIDPGTVHAITAGITILETQQNCDVTYRLYDYDRLENGRPRELHLEKSIDVIKVPAKDTADAVLDALAKNENKLTELIKCKYYQVFKLCVSGEFSMEQSYPFLNMSLISGDGLINGHFIKKGDHFIVPSGFGEIQMNGEMELIISTVTVHI